MSNLKTLIVVESPAKANKIQNYLGDDYIVLATRGHIVDLAKGGRFGLGIDIENNFKPHYMLMEDKITVLDELIAAAKKCDQILTCGDPDREGEFICQSVSSRLEDCGKPIKRIIFNEITKKAILKAVKEPIDINQNIVHAQEGRRLLDRLVGFMVSPFLMNFFGPKLSAGRVQSVLTRIVVDREREIELFQPEEFWTIQVNLIKDKDSFLTKYSGRPTDAKNAEDMRLKLSTAKQYIISEVSSCEESKYPQPPLITSSLQRIMSKDHGISVDRTAKASQALYENSYISYHRTDSKRINDDALKEVRTYLSDNKYTIPKKPLIYKNNDAAQDAHECIHPTDLLLLPNDNYEIIDPDEKLVYETIWKYFVASQMMPAVYDTLKITAHAQGDKTAEVKASGKALKSKGYLEILGLEDNSKIEIPMLAVGDVCQLFGKYPVKMEKKQTQPPPRYSEDKIIKELVNRGIGRPSTYSELLNKICTRNYVEKHGQVFHATDLGKKITDELVKFFTFMDIDYTSKLELQLDKIEAGKLDYVDMLKEFFPKFKTELDEAYIGHGGVLCERCGSPMATRTVKSSGEKFLGCSNFPKCKSTKPIALKVA